MPRRMNMSAKRLGLALWMSVFLTGSAQAVQYSFQVIAPVEDPFHAAMGESQMSVDVLDGGSGTVFFIYSNIGPHASSITDIYVDDGSLLALVAIHNTAGSVVFSVEPDPPNLPRGNNLMPPFEADAAFSADSDPPVQPLGINPYESLSIEYSLSAGSVFSDVLSELESGELRVGIHVQGYESEGSESFVILVPEPATVLMLLAGIVGLRRRRR